MQIAATQEIKINITKSEQRKIALAFLYDNFSWNNNMYIENDKVMESVSVGFSYIWADEKVRRDASEQDKAIFKIVESIKQIKC